MLHSMLPLAQFSGCQYISLHARCLYSEDFQSMPLDGKHTCIYDNRHGVDRLSAVEDFIKCRKPRNGPGAVLWCDMRTKVMMPFIRCLLKNVQARLLASNLACSLKLKYAASLTHSLDYVVFARPYDTRHLQANFDYWQEEIIFKERFRFRPGLTLVVSCHGVSIFGVPTCQLGEVLGQVPPWWLKYKRSCI